MAVRCYAIPSAVLFAALLAGCQGLNLDPQPGPHVAMDTLRPTADFYERVDKPLVQSGASLAGLRRDNWTDTTFYVPVSGVEHQPIYTTDKPRRTDSTARQRGEYPTQASAAETAGSDSLGDQAVEGLLAPVRAGWDVAWMVPKMFVTPPGRTVSSPRVGYERAPHLNDAKSGGLKSMGLGVTLLPLEPSEPPAQTTPAGEPVTAPIGPDGQPVPVVVPPPAPPPQPSVDAPRGPGGAISGADLRRRRNPDKPRPPANEPEPKE